VGGAINTFVITILMSLKSDVDLQAFCHPSIGRKKGGKKEEKKRRIQGKVTGEKDEIRNKTRGKGVYRSTWNW
jgi:hypothetical protein